MGQELLEKKLLKIVQESKRFLDEYESKIKQNYSVLLLIGVTGAGKSTLFNFLAGAEFDFTENEEDGDELNVKHQGDKYSEMKDGMASITIWPKYYYNDQLKHLLIDFPGFYDTKGEMDQLLIQMFFFKIVTISPVKIVYVLRHPENSLVDRGIGLQEFIRDQFQEQNFDSSRFTIILNSYNERLTDEALKQRFKKQLLETYKRTNENVFVVRKVIDQQTLIANFSPQKRYELWQQLVQSHQLKFVPRVLPHSNSVNKYLREKSYDTIGQFCLIINEQLNMLIPNMENDRISQVHQSIKELQNVLQKQSSGNIIGWYVQFIKQSERVFELLGCQNQIVSDCNDFVQIFGFFSQFSQFIDGFTECQRAGLFAKAQCNQMISIINLKIQQLEEKKQSLEQISQVQSKLLVMDQERQQLQQEYQYQRELHKNDQEKLSFLQNQFEQQNQLHKQYQDQLILQLEKTEQEHKKNQEQIASTQEKLISELMNKYEQQQQQHIAEKKCVMKYKRRIKKNNSRSSTNWKNKINRLLNS